MSGSGLIRLLAERLAGRATRTAAPTLREALASLPDRVTPNSAWQTERPLFHATDAVIEGPLRATKRPGFPEPTGISFAESPEVAEQFGSAVYPHYPRGEIGNAEQFMARAREHMANGLDSDAASAATQREFIERGYSGVRWGTGENVIFDSEDIISTLDPQVARAGALASRPARSAEQGASVLRDGTFMPSESEYAKAHTGLRGVLAERLGGMSKQSDAVQPSEPGVGPFDEENIWYRGGDARNDQVFLTRDEWLAGSFARDLHNGGPVTAGHVAPGRQMVVDWGGRPWDNGPSGFTTERMAQSARAEGYDSILLQNVESMRGSPADELVVLSGERFRPRPTPSDATRGTDFSIRTASTPGSPHVLEAVDRNGRVVGALDVAHAEGPWAEGSGPYARGVFVEPEFRRQGVATALYREADRRFGQMVPSEAQNESARAFWQKYRPSSDATRGSLASSFRYDEMVREPLAGLRGGGDYKTWYRESGRRRLLTDDAALEEIPLANLTPIQDRVNPNWETVTATANEPIVVYLRGNYYLIDGHHRAARALARGETNLRARIHYPDGRPAQSDGVSLQQALRDRLGR